MQIQQALEIWLKSRTKLSFKQWLKKQNLTLSNKIVLIIIDLSQVDLVKN